MIESGEVRVKFERKTAHNEDMNVNLLTLDEKAKVDKNYKHVPGKTAIPFITKYFKDSLKLVNALVTKYSSTLDLLIVTYYKYDVLLQAIDCLKKSSSNSAIRMEMAQIIANVHLNYFAITFSRLPRGIRVLH